MRKLALCLALFAPAVVLAALPLRVAGNQVSASGLRLTVLSPTLLRLEASPARKFVDEPTVLVQDRHWPATPFTTRLEGQWLVLRTAALELRCQPQQVPPSADSLRITWHYGARSGAWRPGQADQSNLGGTRGALDGIRAGSLPPLGAGLLSREGWTLLDDSRRPLWRGEEQWLQPRPDPAATDWYFFAYGDDYPHLLREYTRLCGRIPMLPRYALGTWFSRYWDYSAAELQDVVRTFRQLDIPLSVLVIDVDWHKYGWEGYDWNEKQFPDAPGLLRWLHGQGLHVTLNNHPNSPLPVQDTHYAAAAATVGLTGAASGQPLSWDLANPKHSRAFVEDVHWPLERQGVDFWWIDGNAGARLDGLDAALWCARTYYDGTGRRTGERSLVFSRYGGLGQHRYPAGFSGDVYSEWEVLNYEVRFTARAGNVAFPYWSHDIGGFMGNRIDPELYVRWCQFGALSPILRLHSNHGVREPWAYGDEAQRIVRDYFVLRQRLFPYLNACQREAYDTGLPVCRPLYLDRPQSPEAYRYDYEYLLGPDLLVAPIAAHTRADGLAAKEIWLPPGLWWDYWTGEALQGPRALMVEAPLERCPLFVRAGAIIPCDPVADYPGQRPADPITLQVWPGADGATQLYEDDGLSLGYTRGEYAATPLATRWEDGGLHVRIAAQQGTYARALSRRGWVIMVNGVPAPQGVLVDGRPAGHAVYDAAARRVTVRVPTGPVAQSHEVVLRVAASPESLRARAAAGAYARGAAAASKAGGKALPDAARRALAALTEAASADPPATTRLPLLLREAWTALAVCGLPEAERQAAMAQLVGAAATTELSGLAGARDRELKARLATALPLPGATLHAQPVFPPEWQLQGKVTSDLTELATHGAGGLTCTVAPVADMTTPPLGLLACGADFVLQWAGQSLPIPTRGGLDCSFVQQWRLVGPFSNRDGKGLDTVFPPERQLDFAARYPGLEGEVKWQTVGWQLPAGGDPAVFINLEPRFQPRDMAVAYGVTTILADRETEALLSIGSDDSCKVWLNGNLVDEFREPRPPSPGADRVPVTLRAGRNTVLFKVVNYYGQWGFYLQVVGEDGRPLPGLRTTLELTP